MQYYSLLSHFDLFFGPASCGELSSAEAFFISLFFLFFLSFFYIGVYVLKLLWYVQTYSFKLIRPKLNSLVTA